jgi:Flp pilus assembly protein protease CpaA
MKFETLMLKSLFVVCVMAGVLTVGSMLLSKTNAPSVATAHVAAAITAQS